VRSVCSSGDAGIASQQYGTEIAGGLSMKYLATAVIIVIMTPTALIAQTAAQTDCATAAFNQYNAANVALLQQGALPMSAEQIITQRRLEEQYCLRFTQCAGVSDLRARVAFSGCLRDEAMEKYNAESRN
jgi:hypothetical protein